VVLLLGKGHSQNIAQLHGTSGDYYIMGDPAGHYYANSGNGQHYKTVELLQLQWQSINYGGWFAMYPAEKFRTRITKNGVPLVRAMTIGAPFNSFLELQAQSPVTIMVTDPLGNQTGIQTNGPVLAAVPQSSYQPADNDSEDGGSVDPTGPKTVRIESPMAGTYRIDLTGTNGGTYTLVSRQFDAGGTLLGTNRFAGSILPGQQVTYFVTAAPSGPPPLLSAPQDNAVRLFWPTNYEGFTLQTTGNLADTNSWVVAGGVFVAGGFNVSTNAVLGGSRFFRLKK
jgi:hypothetical protein